MSDLVASPLTVILDHALQGQRVERALFCSYTFDAGYFERIALGPLDAIGAQITVVADARMAHIDPYAARRAGTRYGLGLVHHTAAFHPKLFVLLSEEHCTVGIGSANLTAAGWHSSEELWTVVSTTPEQPDATAVQTGAWLATLARTARLGPRVAQTVASIGRRLMAEPADGGPTQVLGNLETPIIDQLPPGPVSELNLYAPFHGQNASAVAALCELMQPEVLRIAFQPGLTSLDPESLLAVTHALSCAVELRSLPAERYRHGKLIEWRTANGWQSLTGSPNLSYAALQSVPASGGNYELAVLTHNDASLLPDADPGAPSGAINQLRAAEHQPEPSGTGPRILEAIVDGDIVELTLTEATTNELRVQSAPAGQPPEQWLAWGAVDTGKKSAQLDPLGGGSWLRVVDPNGGTSPAVAVLGPSAFRLRHVAGGGRSAELPSIDDIFSDPDSATRFLHHLGALSEQLSSDRPSPSTAGGGAGVGAGGGHSESWDEYLDRVTGRLGESLLRFSLGLALHGPQPVGGANWDDEDIDGSEAALESDTAEEISALAQRLTAIPDASTLTEAMRQRLVRQLGELANQTRLDDPVLRLLALRLTLAFLAGGAWPPGDDGWVEVLLAHVDGITAHPSDAPDIRRRQGALAALSLSVCRTEVPKVPETVLSSRISRSTIRANALMNDLDARDLEAYCADLGERLGFRAQLDGVIDFALTAVAATPFSNAVQALAGLDDPIEAIDHAPVLVLPSDVAGSRVQRALLPLKLLRGAGDVAVQIGSDRDAHLVVWATPLLIHISENPRGPVAHVHRFHSDSGPADRQSVSELPKSETVMGPSVDWAEVDEALARVGLTKQHFKVNP